MKYKILNILGTKYNLIEIDNEYDERLEHSDGGICDVFNKEIYINANCVNKQDKDKIIRHEIIHAFFHEAGLQKYSEDEMLVNWIALSLPKLQSVINEVI